MFDRKEYMKNWRKEHPQYAKEKNRDWKLKNPERYKAQRKKLYENRTSQQKERVKIRQNERNKKLKIEFVNMLGGKCSNPNCACKNGYNRSISALEFHHLNPKEKESKRNVCNSALRKLILEGKIKLLCSNCHHEEHEKLNK